METLSLVGKVPRRERQVNGCEEFLERSRVYKGRLTDY